MNKNTRRARKVGLTNSPEWTIGSGESRKVEPNGRHAQEIFKGKICDTSWDNPLSKRTSRRVYKKNENN